MAAERVLDIVLFSCVVLIGAWTCLIKADGQNRRGIWLLKAGMLLTVAADFCLLILNRALAGVVIFCFVQVIYAIRYDIKKVGRTIAWFVTAAAGFMVILTGTDKLMQIRPLYVAGLIYSICLGTAVCRAVLFYRKKEYPTQVRRLILAGMILFLLCDINVALHNILPSQAAFTWMEKPIAGAYFCGILIWIFYLPALLCLALSGRRYHESAHDMTHLMIYRNLRQ